MIASVLRAKDDRAAITESAVHAPIKGLYRFYVVASLVGCHRDRIHSTICLKWGGIGGSSFYPLTYLIIINRMSMLLVTYIQVIKMSTG